MAYALGAASRRELAGVHPDLVRVVERAIEVTRCDFTVHDGIRTVEEQKRHVANGFSKTMRSKHLEGRAVDLVPWIEGKPRWWWPQIYQIAAAMHQAAQELNVPIRWGVVWDRRLNDLAPGVDDPDLLADALRREGLAYNASALWRGQIRFTGNWWRKAGGARKIFYASNNFADVWTGNIDLDTGAVI